MGIWGDFEKFRLKVTRPFAFSEKFGLKPRVRCVNQLVREYLEQVAGKADPKQGADEFVRLSRMSKGNSQGWKFDREEAHERR